MAVRVPSMLLTAVAVSLALHVSDVHGGAATGASWSAASGVTLVSRSGRQPEAVFHESPCPPNSGCAGGLHPARGIGLERASVVRPGETVRFTGLGAETNPAIYVGEMTDRCTNARPWPVATISRRDAAYRGMRIALARDGRWVVHLRPGYYSLSTSVVLRRPGSSRSRDGMRRFRVSRTTARGTVRIPGC